MDTLLLALFTLVDLVSTVVLVEAGIAVEANPLMARFLEYSLPAFCAAKLLFVVPPLLLAEWYRQFNDRLVRAVLRPVTVAYVLIYVVGFLMVNPQYLGPGRW